MGVYVITGLVHSHEKHARPALFDFITRHKDKEMDLLIGRGSPNAEALPMPPACKDIDPCRSHLDSPRRTDKQDERKQSALRRPDQSTATASAAHPAPAPLLHQFEATP